MYNIAKSPQKQTIFTINEIFNHKFETKKYRCLRNCGPHLTVQQLPTKKRTKTINSYTFINEVLFKTKSMKVCSLPHLTIQPKVPIMGETSIQTDKWED